MAEQFRVVSAGQPRGIWRNTYEEAMTDAVDLHLASWDQSKRTYFLAVPVSIERRGEPPPPPEYVYPSRRPRHRGAWNDEDIGMLSQMARAGIAAVTRASQLGRSREAISRKAQQLGIDLRTTKAPR